MQQLPPQDRGCTGTRQEKENQESQGGYQTQSLVQYPASDVNAAHEATERTTEKSNRNAPLLAYTENRYFQGLAKYSFQKIRNNMSPYPAN